MADLIEIAKEIEAKTAVGVHFAAVIARALERSDEVAEDTINKGVHAVYRALRVIWDAQKAYPMSSDPIAFFAGTEDPIARFEAEEQELLDAVRPLQDELRAHLPT